MALTILIWIAWLFFSLFFFFSIFKSCLKQLTDLKSEIKLISSLLSSPSLISPGRLFYLPGEAVTQSRKHQALEGRRSSVAVIPKLTSCSQAAQGQATLVSQ